MKSPKNNKWLNYTILCVIVIYIYFFVCASFPFVLRRTVPFLIALTDKEWAVFLGSCTGGVLGGIGTVIAMVITVRSGFEMQKESREDALRQMQENIKQRDAEKKADLEQSRRIQRTMFVDNVATEIGLFITQLSRCANTELEAKATEKELAESSEKLAKIDTQLREIVASSEKNSAATVEDFVKLNIMRSQLCDERNIEMMRYRELLFRLRENQLWVDRIKVNEIYFSLLNKLTIRTESEYAIQKLKEMKDYNLADFEDRQVLDSWVREQSEELHKAFSQFAKAFIDRS